MSDPQLSADSLLRANALLDPTPHIPSCSPAAVHVLEGVTLGQYLKRQEEREREPFQPWDAILEAIRAKRFNSMSELAKACGQKPPWATALKETVLKQRVLSLDEWRSCFPRKHRLGRPIVPLFLRPEPVAQVVEEDKWSGFTDADGYEESDAVVIERLRTRQFADVAAMARHYGKKAAFIDKFRDGLIRSGVLTLSQWDQCFNGRRTRIKR